MQIAFESPPLPHVNFDPSFHDSVHNLAPRKPIFDSYNTLNQVLTSESKAILLSTILQLAIVVLLAPIVTDMVLEISKYPNYLYSTPTDRPWNGWIWVYGFDIQYLKGVKKNRKVYR